MEDRHPRGIFLSLAGHFKSRSPSLKLKLKQAESGLSIREAKALALETAFLESAVYAMLLFILLHLIGFGIVASIAISMALSLGLFVMLYFNGIAYYGRAVSRRSHDVDKNLLYALQTMQIHVSAGMPVFASIKEISKGKYGAVSAEFRRAVRAVESGSSLEKELEEMALRNPSQNFRYAVWQITNSIKTGADLNRNLEAIVNSVSREELVEIRKYGSKLNPLVLMFMMVAVIIPAMGVTVLAIVSSMPGASAIPETTFWMMLAAVAIVQVFFIRTIKTKRPNISVG